MMRCIYVDDEEALLDIAKEFLELEGDISVDTVSSVETALKLISGTTYDAIISDYQMPEMDGIRFLKRIRSEGIEIPFILFTGRGREEVVIEALKNGADHYIKKGGDPMAQYAELANLVRQTVRRKEAEEAIRYNAIRFRALIENTRDLVTIIDWSGFIIYSSPSTKNALGYTMEEVRGRSVFDYLHPDDRYIEDIMMYSAQRDKCGLPAEFRLRAKDGNYRWFRGSASGYLDEKDRRQVILYAWYIDDRKSIEDELVARDQAYQGIMEHLEEMVFMLDEVGRFLMVNNTLCNFFGRSRDEMLGTPATDIAAPSSQELMFSVVMGKLNGHHAKTRHRYKVLDAGGDEVEIEVTSSVIVANGLKRILGVAVPRGLCHQNDSA
ncbi:Chemotaxis response regulator protein-glutamate methylesterase [anaerobic digester metagenome]|jgi:PAS domain S-box-containing protein|nr:PAS domain S-box protein [Methanomassiliicoccales archaeon]